MPSACSGALSVVLSYAHDICACPSRHNTCAACQGHSQERLLVLLAPRDRRRNDARNEREDRDDERDNRRRRNDDREDDREDRRRRNDERDEEHDERRRREARNERDEDRDDRR